MTQFTPDEIARLRELIVLIGSGTKWTTKSSDVEMIYAAAAANALPAALDEIERLEAKLCWIPISEPPDHKHMVVLAELTPEVITMGAGVPMTIAWYCADSHLEKWVYPAGYHIKPTHYMDCLYFNNVKSPRGQQ